MEKKTSNIASKDIANCDILPQSSVESRIFTIRGVQVIIDKDLAELYGVSTKRLNEQVRRNINRFPASFRFQLTAEETAEVVANCDRLNTLRFSPTKPFAFSEQGVAMLSSVLHNSEAVEISIRIMNAFVAMRHFLLSNAQVFQRLDRIEYKQLETDHMIEQIFDKHNSQYAPIDVQSVNKAHDRFLIIDDKVYHIGASLKDLGKKWFAFSLMQDLAPHDLISRI